MPGQICRQSGSDLHRTLALRALVRLAGVRMRAALSTLPRCWPARRATTIASSRARFRLRPSGRVGMALPLLSNPALKLKPAGCAKDR
jgi:hypothetical protein